MWFNLHMRLKPAANDLNLIHTDLLPPLLNAYMINNYSHTEHPGSEIHI